jgi:hypothetical protein
MSKASYCWRTLKIKDVKLGNYVSSHFATTARLIKKVTKHPNGTISLFDDYGIYLKNAKPTSTIDVLHHIKSGRRVSYRLSKYA